MESKQLNINVVEVSGEAVMAILGGFPDYLNDIAISILLMNGMKEPEAGSWQALNSVLNVLQAISKKFGDATLYEIGKAIPTNAIIPQKVKGLKEALMMIGEGFKVNHRNCEICKSELLEFSISSRKAIIQITNPYPFELNRGIIAGLARKYEPQNSNRFPEVSFEDNSCATLSECEKRCRIRITW